MDEDAQPVLRPPPKWLWAAEYPRAIYGRLELAFAGRRLRAAPKGDGRPILILPGLGNPDWRYGALRRFLGRLGYRASGWGLGLNLGGRTIGAEGERLEKMLRAVHDETGETVTLIGFSLGGLLARLAAHRHPELVREVITVCSPFAGDPRATNVWRMFQWLTGERIDDPRIIEMNALVARPPPVPTTAIWSASDGLVNGALCRSPQGRNIEVASSHLGVQTRPEVMLAIAHILAGAPADSPPDHG